MSRTLRNLLLVAAISTGAPAATVVVKTALGEVEVEIAEEQAPETARNFLRYVEAAAYDGGAFHRTVTPANQPDNKIRIEVVQAAAAPAARQFAPIKLERTSLTRLKHLDGTISMARNGPDTATSDFFICIGDQPSLDFGGKRNPDGQGFAAFGKVVRGMDVVRRIQASPAKGQTLDPPVSILSIRRKRK
jgi:peptidyl-prolyl cis-trans isomerase A (cyclophilin A)